MVACSIAVATAKKYGLTISIGALSWGMAVFFTLYSTMSIKICKVTFLLLAGLVAYSSGAIFTRLATTTVEDPQVGFSLFLSASRLVIASLVAIPAWKGFRKAKYSSQSLKYSVFAGLGLAGYLATWMLSLSYTSIAASTALVNTHPVWAIFLAWWWFRDKPRRAALVGTGFALAGSLIISLGGPAQSMVGANPWLGNGLALVGALSNGLYILLGHYAQKNGVKLQHHIVVAYAAAAVVLLPLPLWLHAGYGGYPKITYGCVLLLALIPQLLGHGCFNWALGWVKPQVLSVVILGEPMVASLLGYWTFGEVQGIEVVVGAVILLFGVAIATISQHQPRSTATATQRLEPVSSQLS
ncbi:DMT family transporter [Leptothoe kymatousa]|nr:DMT family transporter [Leptothoe kymatousa]